MRYSWRTGRPGWLRTVRSRASRANKVVAASTALVVATALIIVAAVVTKPAPPGPPVQQSGTAAGRPHRVPASATIATLANDRVVPAGSAPGRSARRPSAQVPAGKRPRGAVPPAAKPPRVRLGKRPAPGHDRLRSQRPVKKPHVAGFSPRTSRVLTAGTSANRVTYQNADGTRTAMFYQAPVNYRRPDGSWARIDTSLVPVGGRGTPPPSPGPSSLTPSSSAPSSLARSSPGLSPSASPLVPSPSPSLVGNAVSSSGVRLLS